MGSFNMLDFLTKKEITYGTKCKILFIAESRFNDTSSCPTSIDDVYEIIGFPISGKYNDYGGLDDVNQEEWDLQMEVFKELKLTIVKDKYKPDFKRTKVTSDMSLDEILDYLARGRLEIPRCKNTLSLAINTHKITKINKIFILDSVWETIQNECKLSPRELPTKSKNKTTKERIMEWIDEVEVAKTYFIKWGFFPYFWDKVSLFNSSIIYFEEQIKKEKNDSKIDSLKQCLKIHTEDRDEKIHKLGDKYITKVKEMIAEFMIFYLFLYDAKITITPIISGNQHDKYSASQKQLIEMTIKELGIKDVG